MNMNENVSMLRQTQLAELNILKEVVRICDKYGLTYYLSGGTFLGAVRHKGYIPWDDDTDIRMPRPDYERLLTVLKDELDAPYKVDHFLAGNNTKRFPYYFCSVNDPRILLHSTRSMAGEDRCAWIDIFPIDGMPKNVVRNKLRQLRLLYGRLRFQISVFDTIVDLKKIGRPAYEKILIKILTHIPLQKIFNYDKAWIKLDKALKAYPYDKAEYVLNIMSSYKLKDMMKKTVYGKGASYQFEDAYFNGAEDYDTFLTHLYGDYMKCPPENERNKHSTEVIFVNKDGDK